MDHPYENMTDLSESFHFFLLHILCVLECLYTILYRDELIGAYYKSIMNIINKYCLCHFHRQYTLQ